MDVNAVLTTFNVSIGQFIDFVLELTDEVGLLNKVASLLAGELILISPIDDRGDLGDPHRLIPKSSIIV